MDESNKSGCYYPSILHATNMPVRNIPCTEVVRSNENEDKTEVEDFIGTDDLCKCTKFQSDRESRIIMPR